MPLLDKNGHLVPRESERTPFCAESIPGKGNGEEQASMLMMEDSLPEIAEVMQDCEYETQEPFNMGEEKESMPK